ncbi:MAG: hypothetical protein OXC47_03300 [Cyanobacteria bacterium MAG APA_bin_95]|nr:hypothetical protein [Cyanobacteria bacterium MAG APA_bin_95]
MKPATAWPQYLLVGAGATGLVALLLSFSSPGWLQLGGVRPNWLVLWLLPWALSQGSIAGLIGACILGFALETMTIGAATPLYGLALLAWLWGRRKGYSRISLPSPAAMAIQASLGSLLVDVTVMMQLRLLADPRSSHAQPGSGILSSDVAAAGWFGREMTDAGFHGVLAAALVTGFLAPLVSRLLLRLWYRLERSHHG